MTTAILEVQLISKSFGGLQAVSDISFSVQPGDIYGVIGPNGAGKSTLFNMVAGLIRPSAGAVRFQQQDVTALPAYKKCRKGIGRTFQAAQSFSHHTVQENLMAAYFGPAPSLGAWFSSTVSREGMDHIRAILQLTGLSCMAGIYPRDLNNLQLQKLSIGMALVNRPALLLLDEPSGGLIESEVLELEQFIREINAQGTTIVLIDHKMSLVMSLCKNMIVIAAGKFVAQGTPEEILINAQVKEVYLGNS